MKDLIFNELSVQPIAANKTEAYQRIQMFLDTFKKAAIFNKIRFDLAFDQIQICHGYTLNNYCNEPTNRTRGVLLRGLMRYPFIDDDSEEAARFVEKGYFITKNGEKLPVSGLAAAYLYSTFCIAFKSELFWDNVVYQLIITSSLEGKTETVGCISKPEHVEHLFFREWVDSNVEPCLIKTDIAFESKEMSLRDDHGKDVLKEFALRILKNDYVIGVINSLPFNPAIRRFIKTVNPDGTIEIVLNWTDCGYGILVKTTGRTLPETRKIAEMIKNKYSDNKRRF